ncbi:SBBP repeat-containing protein [uncultured Croceitalea sp.]|uniref:SBBP repeat-containing protein n=1 Tax=uncultured Croceitalea sp. TaxID=1798908 RepID=UPI003306606B
MKQTIVLIIIMLYAFSKVQCQKSLPVITYSTYYGSMGTDDADAVTVDLDGNIYLGCHSNSSNLPRVEKNPYTLKGGMDAFLIKLNAKGDKVAYLAQFGGSKWDAIQGLISDDKGNIYAVGTTYSQDFPIHKNGFQTKFGGKSDAFLLKINSLGELVWSTFLGGSQDEDGRDVKIDRQGNVHIIGRTESSDFPISDNAFQSRLAGGRDVFITTFNSKGKLLMSTCLGGSGNDTGFSLAIDSMGRCIISGTTDSSDFPIKSPLQESNSGANDIFLAVFDKTLSNLEFSSYLGGKENDQLYGIDIGPKGDIFLMGMTSSLDFPTTKDSFQTTFNGERDVFVTRLNLRKNRIVYSTYLGGKSAESPRNFVVDKKGIAYIIGQTNSSNFPIVSNQKVKLNGRSDAFITMLNSKGSFLIYSNIFGGEGTEMFEGIAIGADGALTLSGLSNSKDFPVKNSIQDTFMGGRFDIVVMRLNGLN